MKVALYSLVHDEASIKIVTEIVAFFASKGAGIQVEKELLRNISNAAVTSFSSHEDLDQKTTVFFAVGGDGTVLRALHYIRESKIPLIGVNTGRLGFLAPIQPDEMEAMLDDIITNNYLTRPPLGGTLTIVPSSNFKSACCTPSPCRRYFIGHYWPSTLAL